MKKNNTVYKYSADITKSHSVLSANSTYIQPVSQIMQNEGESAKTANLFLEFFGIDTEKINKAQHPNQNQKVVDMAFCVKSTNSEAKKTVLCEMKYRMTKRSQLKKELKDCASKIKATKAMLGHSPQFAKYSYFLIKNSQELRRVVGQRSEEYGVKDLIIKSSAKLKEKYF